MQASNAVQTDANGNSEDLRYTCKVIGLAFLVGLIPGIWFTGAKWGAPLMAACACFSVGAILGLLFGIPRSLQAGAHDPKNNEPGAAGGGFGENTNLEQISDWLTKILIGASLVQMREIKDLLIKLATQFAQCLGGDACVAFALFLIVYFAALGFLGSYLLSRLFLPGALRRAQIATQAVQIARVASQKADEATAAVAAAKQLTELVGKMSGVIDPQPLPAASAPAAGGATVNLTGAQAAADDPNKGQFGGKAEMNNRQLSATVKPMAGSSDYFLVHLEVKATGGETLGKPVSFHLHPSFSNPVVERTPKEEMATLDLVCWGAFTVGAVTDDGKTRMELDLAELPGAPKEFTSR